MAFHQHIAIINSSRRWRGWIRPASRADGRASGDIYWQLQEKPRRAKARHLPTLSSLAGALPAVMDTRDGLQPLACPPKARRAGGSASLGLLCDGAPLGTGSAWGSWGQPGGPGPQAKSMERSPAHPAYNAALNTVQLEHASSGLAAGSIRQAGKAFLENFSPYKLLTHFQTEMVESHWPGESVPERTIAVSPGILPHGKGLI